MIEDAARLWVDIPVSEIPRLIDLAIIKAAPYMATAALVAKCWMDSDSKELNLGAIRMSESQVSHYAKSLEDMPKNDPKVVEQFFAQMQEFLK